MRRFFFTVDEAVALVGTALSYADELRGSVLSREMKAAQIQEILDVWIERFGGSWERIKGRPGERDDEFLIGDLELQHTSERTLNSVRHFVISFNERVPDPISVGLSSANAERLTAAEILRLIEDPPPEEN
jgi:FlaA1/EpsC-like NDP-sugar epimerase